MAKLFIDVGGFHGEASHAALDPRFGFDKVYCIEPVPECCDYIRTRLSDSRLNIVQAALADRDGEASLYGPSTLAGSLFSDHIHVDACASIHCKTIRASRFLEGIFQPGDRIWLKLNCEGSEIPVLEDLISTGWFARIESALLDFDAIKIPSLLKRHEAVTRSISSLSSRNWYLPEQVQYGQQCTFGGIRNWLIVSHAVSRGFYPARNSFLFHFGNWKNHCYRGYYKFLIVRRLPAFVMKAYYRNVKPRLDKAQPNRNENGLPN